MGPLVKILWLVDNERKSAMGYIYETIDRCNKITKKSFNENENKYKEIFSIIDKRWECQLHHPLHVKCHFLNPKFFYENHLVEFDENVTSGLYSCIDRFVFYIDVQDKIICELSTYKNAEALFSIPIAIRSRNMLTLGIKYFKKVYIFK